MWLRIETGDGESGIEPSGSIKCRRFSIEIDIVVCLQP